jgi:flagellar motor component MotA
MVAMSSVIGGWLISGRSTMRSVSMPSTTITTSVTASASQKLTPFSTITTKVSAAKNTIEPCAKLNTPEAL